MFISKGFEPNVSPFPPHTQAVERYNKLVTESYAAVYGGKSSGSYIRARLLARQKTKS